MFRGIVNKMGVRYETPVQYSFILSDNIISSGPKSIPLNQFLNKDITLQWTGEVQCLCGKRLAEFYRQNFCYKCFWNAPQASPSIF